MINEGEEAPDFELPDQDNNKVRLSDYKGRWVILYFFPKAFTPGCTMETQEFSSLWNEFNKLGVEVFGISVDSVGTQKRFATKYSAQFKLLSDKEKSVSRAYGVLRPTGTAERVTFIISPEGKVSKVIKNVSPREHPRKALEYLSTVLKQGSS